MKFCSIPGCGVSVTDAQAETAQKLFGKIVCVNHEKGAAADVSKEADKFTLDTAPYIKCGFAVENGIASKIIGQAEITVDIAKKSAGKSNKESIQMGGYDYEYGINPAVDSELKILFTTLKGGAVEKKENKPAPKDRETVLPAINQNTQLSVETIRQYINPKATEQEAFMFLQLCKARNLNPFLKEAYLIKYSESEAAAFVVGKDAFTKRADMQPDFKGFQAGIIVQNVEKKLERREGSLLLENEKLIGGWAKVFRKDREPYLEEVGLNEYIKLKDGKPMRSWATMPSTMIRKVAIVHALREAFPQEFSGLYDQSEIQEVI